MFAFGMQLADARIETVTMDLYALGKLLRNAWRVQVPELAPASIAVLAALVAHGPMRVGEVAEVQHIDVSVASRQVTLLAIAGLVTREKDGEDARARRVRATDRGQQLMADAHARILRLLSSALGDWTAQDLGALTAGLGRLRADVGDTLETCTRRSRVAG